VYVNRYQRSGFRPRDLLLPRQALSWLSYALLVMDGEGFAPPLTLASPRVYSAVGTLMHAHP
jgi:hypothetical protein